MQVRKTDQVKEGDKKNMQCNQRIIGTSNLFFFWPSDSLMSVT